jgi:REP-associated tyrosine transposase
VRDDRWSEAIAVGSFAFVETVKNNLGVKAMHREVIEADGTYGLREPAESYERNFTGEIEPLSAENTLLWDESGGNVGT